jgi:hypothetical protein
MILADCCLAIIGDTPTDTQTEWSDLQSTPLRWDKVQWCFLKTGSGIQKLFGRGGIERMAISHKLNFIFQNKEGKLKKVAFITVITYWY